MFMSSLSERITVEQLGFMLKCHDHIQKVGAVVLIKIEDQPEQVTEYYMSQDQIERPLQQWWKHRYRPKFLQHYMEYAVARPAMHLEATKRYILMNDILSVSILEFAADTVSQMHEMLQKSRLVPRLTQKAFSAYIRSMIPFITDQDCDRFYRATVSKTVERMEVSQKAFRKLFAAGSILSALEDSLEQDPRLMELLETVGNEWVRHKDRLILIRQYFATLSR
jgi:sugar diacid utilization regulator